MGAHLEGDLEAGNGHMAQCLDVSHGGDGAKAGGEKGSQENFKNKTKRGLLQLCKVARERQQSK